MKWKNKKNLSFITQKMKQIVHNPNGVEERKIWEAVAQDLR